ncbi:MAG: hypothetical protein AAFV38_02550 [Pseudomonadota bacterium]
MRALLLLTALAVSFLPARSAHAGCDCEEWICSLDGCECIQWFCPLAPGRFVFKNPMNVSLEQSIWPDVQNLYPPISYPDHGTFAPQTTKAQPVFE